jgi:hypothetical protein
MNSEITLSLLSVYVRGDTENEIRENFATRLLPRLLSHKPDNKSQSTENSTMEKPIEITPTTINDPRDIP